MADKDLREKLAGYAHDAWSRYMRHMFGKCVTFLWGGVYIPSEYAKNIQRKIDGSYDDLTWTEQESDRREADKMIDIFVADLPEEPPEPAPRMWTILTANGTKYTLRATTWDAASHPWYVLSSGYTHFYLEGQVVATLCDIISITANDEVEISNPKQVAAMGGE